MAQWRGIRVQAPALLPKWQHFRAEIATCTAENIATRCATDKIMNHSGRGFARQAVRFMSQRCPMGF